MLTWQHHLAAAYANLEFLALLVATFIALSAVDDMVIDLWYWVRRLQRWRMQSKQAYRPLTEADVRARPEQPLAIMVPAWQEFDVIAQMIESMVATLAYKNYVIFVGTYCNDPATAAEVDRMRRRYKQLRRVDVPNPGPTCKADCLNWVVQAIFLYEQQNDMAFAGTVLHDSEDVLHPLELTFFNYLLPRMDMVQLPVLSLERKWYELVAGTYMDEFAEAHGKDMLVREAVSGVIPSAGVGTCFSRRALISLCEHTQNQPFNTASLTEDYDIGNRLAQMGMRTIFAVFPVDHVAVARPGAHTQPGAAPAATVRHMPLCVQEYFPDTLVTAYRQKARWTLGIGLQGWEQLRFSGSLGAKYLMLRDRKGVLTAFISMLAYACLLGFMVFHALAAMGLWTVFYPSVFLLNDWSDAVLFFNALSLVSRAGHRAYFVTRLYGGFQGLMSFPRMIVSNFVNFLAVARAWRIYLGYLFLGKAVVWDKTMHDFPSADTLALQKHRLGELLLTWQAVDAEQLCQAVAEQQRHHLPLGRVMVMNGWLDDETLAEAIAYQTNLLRANLSPDAIWAHRADLPYELCVRHRVLPMGLDGSHRPLLAVGGPLTPEQMAEITTHSGQVPVLRVVRESELAAGLRQLTPSTGTTSAVQRAVEPTPLLGDVLIRSGQIARAQFEAALVAYRPQQHGRIGDYLVDQGVIAREAIEAALAVQRGAEMAAVRSQPLALAEAA